MRWIKQNKLELLIVLLILTLAAFFRFYRLDEYMTFLGDEGRDALVIKDILINYHIPLLGPPTSVGNMYLGPLYYYMMAIPMSVFYLNPVAAAAMDAVIGIATVFLIYYLSRVWFGKFAAYSSSFLYALSPITIIYSKSSWNPNPAPFFALLLILGFFLSRKNKNYLWLILSGASLAFVIQMHYLALILIPVAFVIWLREMFHKNGKHFLSGTVGFVVIFLLLMSPLVIFDLRHNLMNYRALTTLFLSKDSSVGFNFFNLLQKLSSVFYFNLVNRYITGANPILITLGSILVALPILILGFQQYQKKTVPWPIFVLTTWLIMGTIGLSFVKLEIYDHYVGFLNPVPFLFLGANFYLLEKSGINFEKYIKYLLLGIILVFALVSLTRSPLLIPPNRQLQRTQEVAKFVISQSSKKPFNFALLAARNYDSAYQFYLGQLGHPPKKVPFEKTDQLFVVCEDLVCEPINNPKYEISGWGYAKIIDQKEVAGVKVFKLVHNPSGKP